MSLPRTPAVLVLLLLAGCSHLHPWATDRDIEGTYDQVFQATVEMLEERQFPLTEVDRAGGRIVTGKRPVRVIETHRRVEHVRARLEPEDGAVDVRLFLTFMDQSGTVRQRSPDRDDEEADVVMDKMFSSGVVYDDYLDAIEERVEAMRTPETE